MPFRVPLLDLQIKQKSSPQSSEVQAVHQYWLDLADGNIPPRALLHPEDLVPYLPRMWIVDVIDAGADFRLRLHGTQAVEDTGRDLTGTLLSETVPALANKWVPFLKSALESRSCRFGETGLLTPGKDYYLIEVMAAPLTDGADSIAKILVFYDILQELELPIEIELSLT